MAVRCADCTRRGYRNREASETRFAQTADASLSDFGTRDASPSNGDSGQRQRQRQRQRHATVARLLRYGCCAAYSGRTEVEGTAKHCNCNCNCRCACNGNGNGNRRCAAPAFYRGRTDAPIRNSSTARAHCLPSRIAHTTSDWPRRTSPAANTLSTEVW